MQNLFGGKKASSGAAEPASDEQPSSSKQERTSKHREVGFDGTLVTTKAVNDEKFEEYLEEYADKVYAKGEGAHIDPAKLDTAGLSPELLQNIKEKLNYKTLLPLQERTIPILLHEHKYSILVHSPTGSGKTAAFGIPALQIAMNFKKKNVGSKAKKGPSVIVVCTTQNLGLQIRDYLRVMAGGAGMGANTGITVFGLFHGGDRHYDLRKAADIDIIVATMGSLVNKIDRGFVELGNLQLLVVDEADQMVSYASFGQDVQTVLNHIPDEVRENMRVAAFSATYEMDDLGDIDYEHGVMAELFNSIRPTEITVEAIKGYIKQRLILVDQMSYQREPLGLSERDAQRFRFVDSAHMQKISKLMALLDHDKEQYFVNGKYTKTAVIFVERITTCNFLATYLLCFGYNVLPLNSNYDLESVKQTLRKMADGEIQAVISTNKMARGQDIPDLHHVIVYEMSGDFKLYKHRIGRTGRIGHGGISTAFFDLPKDSSHIGPLFDFMQEHGQKIPKWLGKAYKTAVEIHAYYAQAPNVFDDDNEERPF